MTPQTSPPDQQFITALSSDIRGIYFSQVESFTAARVEAEFRKIVGQPDLVANDGLMDNLMFVVRKKDILALRGDVEAALNLPLKPHADASAMKTLYALGGERERSLVDERYARRLYAEMQTGDGVPRGPFLPAADRVGGPKTATLLKALIPEAAARQREAETKTPLNHVRLGQLDKIRYALETELFNLSRKLEIAAMREPKRPEEMLQLYLRHSAALGDWAYVELVNHSSAASIEAVRRFLANGADSLVPKALPEESRKYEFARAHLDGLVLLRAMKAPLSPEEEKALEPYPRTNQPDWEDVLDKV